MTLSWFKEKPYPFQFGPVAQRDRVMVSTCLPRRGQGNILEASHAFEPILSAQGTDLDCASVARDVFRILASFFSPKTVRARLASAPVIGFMSDSTDLNGMAGRVHPGEPKHFVNVTVGVLLRGLVATYRITGAEAHRLSQPVLTCSSSFYDSTFYIPGGLAARKYALKSAVYGLLAVFFHEIAHVFRGHTSYIQSSFGVSELDELNRAAVTTIQTRRLLEIDADDYAGQFLAHALFSDVVKQKSLLENKAAMRRFVQVVLGVLTIYLGFGPSNQIYYSGPVRAQLVLGSLLMTCTNNRKDGGKWLRELISDIKTDMVSTGMMPAEQVQVDHDELARLLNNDIPKRDSSQRSWTTRRDWD